PSWTAASRPAAGSATCSSSSTFRAGRRRRSAASRRESAAARRRRGPAAGSAAPARRRVHDGLDPAGARDLRSLFRRLPGEGVTGGLDEYVLALGRAGVAVRRLELLVSPLESMFFALTGEHSAPAEPEPVAEQPGAVR